MLVRLTLLGVFVLLAAETVVAQSTSLTHEFELDNGLKLIVQEDHRAPVAVVQVWYAVGSSYEHDGITGVSHVLEHMMFKRTKNLDNGEFSAIVSANGGRENAFTGSDYTAYFQEWAAENVTLSFELEADRMTNLVVEDDELAREMKVVMEERRLRTDDNPAALALEAARAVAYQTSPYRQPIIGWEADLVNLEASDVRRWYDRWYGPNNAVVVVVGDVDPQDTYLAAKTHFGKLAAREIPPPKSRPEVAQRGKKTIEVVSSTAKVPYLFMGFKAPTLATPSPAAPEWEVYALDVLAALLDGNSSARLPTNLVRGQELATEVGAGYNGADRLETLFYMTATPRGETDMATLEAALLEQITDLQSELVDDQELKRVKTQVVAESVFELDSMFFQGMVIGFLETAGLDWRLKDEYVQRIEAVSAEQVRAVAKKYLIRNGLTVTHLLPEEQS
ncbi:MAG: pitrilysin family protein [Pseudomonadota bacterium]